MCQAHRVTHFGSTGRCCTWRRLQCRSRCLSCTRWRRWLCRFQANIRVSRVARPRDHIESMAATDRMKCKAGCGRPSPGNKMRRLPVCVACLPFRRLLQRGYRRLTNRRARSAKPCKSMCPLNLRFFDGTKQAFSSMSQRASGLFVLAADRHSVFDVQVKAEGGSVSGAAISEDC